MPVSQNNTVVALDVGEKRIGVAIAHHQTGLVQPWGTLDRNSETIVTVRSLLDEQRATVLVLGLPRGLDGQETTQTHRVRAFADELRDKLQVPLHFQDEALTSKQAEQELAQRGVSYTKGEVDALAASYILTDFLQEHREFYEHE